MSYCRFLEADAYIYDDVNYGIICCFCWTVPDSGNFIAGYDYDMMLNHISEHRSAGDYIPTRVDEELIKERDCDHSFVEHEHLGLTCSKCWRRESI